MNAKETEGWRKKEKEKNKNLIGNEGAGGRKNWGKNKEKNMKRRCVMLKERDGKKEEEYGTKTMTKRRGNKKRSRLKEEAD